MEEIKRIYIKLATMVSPSGSELLPLLDDIDKDLNNISVYNIITEKMDFQGFPSRKFQAVKALICN